MRIMSMVLPLADALPNTPACRIAKLLFFGDFDFAERDADGKLVRRRRQVQRSESSSAKYKC
jgi:hypothetical protein